MTAPAFTALPPCVIASLRYLLVVTQYAHNANRKRDGYSSSSGSSTTCLIERRLYV